MSKVRYTGPLQRIKWARARMAREKYDAELAIAGSKDSSARLNNRAAAAIRAYPELAELKTLLDAQMSAMMRGRK